MKRILIIVGSILFLFTFIIGNSIDELEKETESKVEIPTPTPTIDLTKLKKNILEPSITPTIVESVSEVNAFSLDQIFDKGLELLKIKPGKKYIWKKDRIEEVKE